MNDLSLRGDFLMTISEVAEVLGVSPEAIKRHVRELYPELLRNGIATHLSERHVTEIKRRMIPTTQVVGAVTSLEMAEKAREVMAWLTTEADRLRAELESARPKIESFDALMRSERQMSITDAAKHFGLHPLVEVFPYLRARGYLTRNNLPTQSAIDVGYLSLKETKDQSGNIWPQAVVEAWQLERWRAHVVPQIKRYHAEVHA